MTVHEYPRNHGSLSGLSDTDHHTQYALNVQGLLSARPLPGRAGRLYYATDNNVLYRDSGTTWTAPSIPAGTTISASAVGEVPLAVRGITGQTANLLEARDSAGALLARVGASGSVFGTILGASPTNAYVGGRLSVDVGAAGTQGLVVRGAPAQTANLAEFQDSTGAVLASVEKDGAVQVVQLLATSNSATKLGLRVRGAASQTANLAEFQDSAGTVGTYVRPLAGATINGLVTSNLFVPIKDTADRGLVVRGAASQTGNLAEFQNSAGTALAHVNADGGIVSTRQVFVQAGATTIIPLIAQGVASQTANLFEARNSGGVVQLAIDPAGWPVIVAGSGHVVGTAVAGVNGAPPATVEGYWRVKVGATEMRVPYYKSA